MEGGKCLGSWGHLCSRLSSCFLGTGHHKGQEKLKDKTLLLFYRKLYKLATKTSMGS